MKNLLPKSSANPLALAKKLVLTGLIIGWLLAPELLWHKLTFLLHISYESLSFLLEQVLIHSLGLTKFYAQIVIFYSFSALALLALYLMWRRLPCLIQRIKSYFKNLGIQIKYKTLQTWLELSVMQKIKFLLFQFAGIAGGLMVLLA